jgi:hypothetical protein
VLPVSVLQVPAKRVLTRFFLNTACWLGALHHSFKDDPWVIPRHLPWRHKWAQYLWTRSLLGDSAMFLVSSIDRKVLPTAEAVAGPVIRGSGFRFHTCSARRRWQPDGWRSLGMATISRTTTYEAGYQCRRGAQHASSEPILVPLPAP